MNPSSKQSGEVPAALNLPPPVAEQLPPTAAGVPEARPEATGQVPAAAERAPSAAASGATAAQMMPPALPVADDATPLAQTPQTSVKTTSSRSSKKSLIKDDDLIDNEWVDKAKRIVQQTRDDPHQQSEQLTLVKAEYMKQRYGKTIKVSK